MRNLFWPLAAGLYQKFKTTVHKKQNQKIQKQLSQLYPLKNGEKLYDNYQIKKLAAVCVIWTIGIVFVICFHLCSRMEGKLTKGTQLQRNDWGVGDYEITLLAKTEEWSKKISFLVKERKLTDEETNKLLSKLQKELPEIIKNDNQDLQHVTSDLNLPSFVTGYPFVLTWSSADSKQIDHKGRIVDRTGISEKGQKVVLAVTAAYGEKRNNFEYEVTLLPEMADEEELFFGLVEKKLQVIDQKEETNKVITLPQKLNGKQIQWEEITTDKHVLFLAVFILVNMAVCLGMDNDLRKNCDKRKKQLIMDYSGFVSKLRLYLSAGINAKNAFMKVKADYGQRQGQKASHYLYEEMNTACHQLENGMMEEQVYQEFGKRCGEMQYRRLGFLLSVHVKQGNRQLLTLLESEADGALEDRRNRAKKAGEEAGTKLLLPMMLMLIVVMFLILFPAYFDFGSI